MILHSHNQKNEKDDSATGNTQITNDYINTPETNELRIYTDENKITGKYENEQESIAYPIPFGAHVRVKKGDKVYNGDKITEGAISPKELLEVTDIDAVSQYILKEIQKVYGAQGIGISDKHIEVIVRQMLRKVFVVDAGDTNLLSGTRVSLNAFTEENERVLREGKHPAVFSPLILGITKAALATESFLSAASFQETSKVLTDAAIHNKYDPLMGLKENVIIGKLIPAGTGVKDYKNLTPQYNSVRPVEDLITDLSEEDEDII